MPSTRMVHRRPRFGTSEFGQLGALQTGHGNSASFIWVLPRVIVAPSAMAGPAGGDSKTESLLPQTQRTTCCGGLTRDCTKWIQWRNAAGSTGSRVPWQVLCSLLLFVEMVPYFKWVQQTWVLEVIGCVFVMKCLVETQLHSGTLSSSLAL